MRRLCLCLCLTSLCGPAQAAPVEVRIGNIAPEGSSYDTGCAGALRTEVSRDPVIGAKLRVKVFLGAVLGDEANMLRHTREGKLLQVVALTMSALANLIPELGVFDLPFLFHNDAEVDAVFRASAVRARLRALVGSRDLELVGIAEAGWRQFASRDRPIRTPDDLKGRVVRSQPTVMQLEMWRALGAQPKPIGISDLPAAFEAGQVDAFDIQSAFMFAASLHSLVRHYTLSNHVYQAAPLVANRRVIAPENMKSLMEAWSRIERKCIETIRAENRLVDAELPKAGIRVATLSPEARAAFEEKLAPLRQRFRQATTPAGRALFDAVEKVLARHRGRRVN